MVRLRPALFPLLLCCVGLVLNGGEGRAAWTGQPSPHEGKRLVVVRPADWRNGEQPAAKAVPGAAFDQAATLAAPVEAPLHVREAGEYVVWVRVANRTKTFYPLRCQVFGHGQQKPSLTATLNDGPGQPGQGGSLAFQAYAKAAQATAPGAGDVAAGELSDEPSLDKVQKSASKEAAEFEALVAADAGEERETTNWVSVARLEEPQEALPFYWWKVGTAELTVGQHRLVIAPVDTVKADRAPLVDVAFASTAVGLEYPFLGDLDAQPASYVRFRLDQIPEDGLSIALSLRIHYDPFSAGPVHCNPQGMSPTKVEPHTRTGFTRWYRLQDIERAPPFGPAESQLHLSLNGQRAVDVKTTAGATQFAVFPHGDYVLREFDWRQPDGLNLSFAPDFQTYLHLLRTLRDCAREDYERAYRATGGALYPLTRDGLYFGNAWGSATGDAHEYMVKTLRLLGFNCVGEAEDPIRSRQLYGWTSQGGQYWPETHLPFDEQQAVAAYDADYRNFFQAQREFYEGVSVFQVADEPGEISRSEMSAPLWRYLADDKTPHWLDVTGGSILTTRDCKLKNCVLEGKIAKLGTWIGFRVAVDDPHDSKRYAEWRMGTVGPSLTINVMAAKQGYKNADQAALQRRAATVPATATPFKIVHDGSQAALYINGQLVHQHIDVDRQGGFSIIGAQKQVFELRLRPLAKGERLLEAGAEESSAVAANEEPSGDDDLDALLGDESKASQGEGGAGPVLEKFVREKFVASGGVPGAHEAFRHWARQQGLEPADLGCESWEQATLLTVPALVTTPAEARRFYWSRRFSGWLTPHMFGLSADAIRRYAPNQQMLNFVALSGHSLYFPSETPLDMFQLAADTPAMMPGISDWMSYGGWRWDSHQAVAFSIAPYNAGARRYDGTPPQTFPMMHCVWPSELRAYTMLANNCRFISYFNYGPSWAVTEGGWSESEESHRAVHRMGNRAAQCDDILTQAVARPSRVAMLYAMSNEYWDPQSSFADKRATFLALSHEYYQPELVTEEQVRNGALDHYEALYVLDPIVEQAVQERIAQWVDKGGLLWTCADALTKNEFNEPADLLAKLDVCQRKLAAATKRTVADGPDAARQPPLFQPAQGSPPFRAHVVSAAGQPTEWKPGRTGQILGVYSDGRPGWVRVPHGQGQVYYLGHRGGLSHTALAVRLGGYEAVWPDTGRDMLVRPLHEAAIARPLSLSTPVVMASALSSDAGTVVVLCNMRPQPQRDVEVVLAESQRPASVECFDDLELQPLAFTFADGKVRCVLPELAGGQMIVVRRQAPPADTRTVQIRERTTAQWKSRDWRALSAAAWHAGAFPEWNMRDQVIAQVRHPQWQVRQAAVEALGRIGDAPAAAALAEALDEESDAHVLGDALLALAQCEGPESAERCWQACVAHARHTEPFVRQQAVRAARKLRGVEAEALAAWVGPLAEDKDLRVRREAASLLASVSPEKAIGLARRAFADATATAQERQAWAEALASQPAAWDTAVAAIAEAPSQDAAEWALLIALAQQRQDARLAQRLLEIAPELGADPSRIGAFVAAAIRQRNPQLAQGLFAQRARLTPTLATYVPLILESTFDARLGHVEQDWAEHLKN